jgi:hypothetical protein
MVRLVLARESPMVTLYEVERVYLTDATGQPEQTTEPLVTVKAASAKDAAILFVEKEGARLLGTVCDSPADLCTATAWREGRLYALTVWKAGHRPVAGHRSNETQPTG